MHGIECSGDPAHATNREIETMRYKRTGFTLLGIIVSLGIAAVLLLAATSVLATAMTKAEMASARSSLLSSVTRSVAHAARTGSEVILCPGDRRGCSDTFNWSRGWIAFADIDGNRRRDEFDTMLQEQAALGGGVELFTSTGRRRLVFQPSGGNLGSNVTFTLCASRSGLPASTLVLSNRGRLRTGRSPRSGTCQRLKSASLKHH